MDIDSCRYLLAVYKYRNISAAARKLYISQSALTKHINKIESQIGAQLFIRNTMPIGITKAGEEYVAYAQKLLNIQQEMLASVSRVALNETADISIACTLYGANYLRKTLTEFQEKYPDIRLSVEDHSAEECEKMLEAHNCDIILYSTPVNSDDIEYVSLEDEMLVLVAAPNSQLYQAPFRVKRHGVSLCEITAEDLNQETYIMCVPGRSIAYSQKALLDECNIMPRRLLYFENLDVAVMMAFTGLGVALAPLKTAKRFSPRKNDPVFLMVKDKSFDRSLIIAKHRDSPLDSKAQQFWDFMLQKKAEHRKAKL